MIHPGYLSPGSQNQPPLRPHLARGSLFDQGGPISPSGFFGVLGQFSETSVAQAVVDFVEVLETLEMLYPSLGYHGNQMRNLTNEWFPMVQECLPFSLTVRENLDNCLKARFVMKLLSGVLVWGTFGNPLGSLAEREIAVGPGTLEVPGILGTLSETQEIVVRSDT